MKTRNLILNFKNQNSEITSLAFIPSSTHICVSSLDKSVCFYDIGDERFLVRMTKFESSVQDLAISGNLLYTACLDGHIQKFCPSQSIDPVTTIKTRETTSISVSDDGKIISTGHLDGSVSFWDTISFSELAHFPVHSQPIVDLRFISESNVFSAGQDGGLAILSSH